MIWHENAWITKQIRVRNPQPQVKSDLSRVQISCCFGQQLALWQKRDCLFFFLMDLFSQEYCLQITGFQLFILLWKKLNVALLETMEYFFFPSPNLQAHTRIIPSL